jgi:hypothetical protein
MQKTLRWISKIRLDMLETKLTTLKTDFVLNVQAISVLENQIKIIKDMALQEMTKDLKIF